MQTKSSLNLAALALVCVQVVLADNSANTLRRYYNSQVALVQQIMSSSLYAQDNIVFSPESMCQARFVDGLLIGQVGMNYGYFEKIFGQIVDVPKALLGEHVELKTLNRIFYAPNMSSFYQIDRNAVGVRSEEMNFHENTELVRSYINLVVSFNTNALIPKFLEELSPNTLALLVNSIYFKGSWHMPFDVEMTQNAIFESPTGKRTVPMMNGDFQTRHIVYNNADVVELPYNRSHAISMYVLLPKNRTEDLRSFAANLNLTTVSALMWDAPHANIAFSMPKLDLVSHFDLKQVPNFEIKHFKDVKHHVRLMIDEKGTEGAAATGGSAIRMTFVTVACNHPYIFTVYNKVLNSILFFGAVVNP